MKKLVSLEAVAAAVPLANVDTDVILPGRFLKTITRTGLGDKLFWSLRYDGNGRKRPDFVLNREPWTKAGILIALENFGCGSSREHAPWSLLDFGIRCIVAPSFADIFYNNCFKNGILAVRLERDAVDALIADAASPATSTLRVDVKEQFIFRANGESIGFRIEAERKQALLEGLDEIANSLAREADILAWERRSAVVAPSIPVGVGTYANLSRAAATRADGAKYSGPARDRSISGDTDA